MKFKIKTLHSRDVVVDLSEQNTVWELKRHVCRQRGVWLHPEYQRLIYAGQVMDDRRPLGAYCIDQRRFLLLLPRRTPPKKMTNSQSVKRNSSSTSTATMVPVPSQETTTTRPLKHNDVAVVNLKQHLMNLGPWQERDVRQALLISLNNPRRALDYLTFVQAPFRIMLSPPPSSLCLNSCPPNREVGKSEDRLPLNPELQTEPNSECELDDFWSRTGLTSSESTSSEFAFEPRKLNLRDPMLDDIRHLVRMGFPQDVVIKTYKACEKNVEIAEGFLYEKYLSERRKIIKQKN